MSLTPDTATMARFLSSLLAFFSMTGCQSSAPDKPISIKELIATYQDVPLGESIHEVSRHLAQCAVLLPTEGVHEKGESLRLAVSTDNQGRIWAYAYTDESELLAAFPKGRPIVRLRFADAFAIVAGDRRFGGIFINHSDQYKYLIPMEVFDVVQAALDAAPKVSDAE